jgi:hypothetical protein
MKSRTVRLALVTVAVLALRAAEAPVVAAPQARTVDAVTLALAVRAGQAKQYEGFAVTGEGRSFDANCTPGDPARKIEAAVPLTLAALGPDGKPVPVVTLEDYVNFQMVGRVMLMVKLRGPELKIKPEADQQHPVLYTFTGTYRGETESVTPPASIMDNNPKPFVIAIVANAVAR